MKADAIERIAEDHGRAGVCIIERLHAHVVARAEQAAARSVPNGKSKVAQQMLYTFLRPNVISVQDQLDIGKVEGDATPAFLELRYQLMARVYPRIGNYGDLPIERERL